MGEFFNGWRRRVGLSTLFVALLLVGVWFRSIGERNIVYLAKSDYRIERLVSANSTLMWEQFRADVPMAMMSSNCLMVKFEDSPNCFLSSLFCYTLEPIAEPDPTKKGFFEDVFPTRPIKWRWSWCSLGIGECHHSGYDGNARLSIVRVPYWATVLPFTLISAYFLLIRPRKWVPTKNIQPRKNN